MCVRVCLCLPVPPDEAMKTPMEAHLHRGRTPPQPVEEECEICSYEPDGREGERVGGGGRKLRRGREGGGRGEEVKKRERGGGRK